MCKKCPMQTKLAILEFLKNDPQQPSQIITNLKIEGGNVNIDKSTLGNYRHVYFYIRNENGVVIEEVNTESPSRNHNDLTL